MQRQIEVKQSRIRRNREQKTEYGVIGWDWDWDSIELTERWEREKMTWG